MTDDDKPIELRVGESIAWSVEWVCPECGQPSRVYGCRHNLVSDHGVWSIHTECRCPEDKR